MLYYFAVYLVAPLSRHFLGAHRAKRHGEPCEFHAVRDRLVPFKPIGLDELSVQPITEVVLGPKHLTPEPVIQDFLAQRGFVDVDVRTSSASYR